MRCLCALYALCLALTPVARADVAVETWAAGKQATHPGSIVVREHPGGGGVIRVDLKALPAGAKIHSARLLLGREAVDGSDEAARAAGEVFGVVGTGAAGKLKPEPKPLAIPPPWFDHFDAAATLRRQLAKGKTTALFLVKSFPKWLRAETRLEIRYEGMPREIAGRVKDLKAVHRAGQTFLTWREVEDPFGDRPVRWGELRERLGKLDEKRRVRYLIYRHTAPIDNDGIAAATLLAEVRPLSGFNVNSWSKERLINQAVFGNEDKGELGNYNPFGGWDRDSAQGGRLVIPRFVIPGSDKPIPPGTGLYVHSVRRGSPQAPSKAGKAHYAVVTSIDGTASACDYFKADAAGAVVEKPAAWEPVLQSAGRREFGFDFPGEKRFYVTWVAPPLSNVPRYFNWSVHVPPEMKGPAPLNVSFHDLGFSYAKPIRRYDRSAVQIAGHDSDPVSGWYGYHESLGTVRSWGGGKVQPYTERRVLAFMEWAKKTWKIDPDRCFTDGRGMGGLGAIHFACKHPELFAYVLNDQGAVCCREANCLPALEDAWGRVEWGLTNDQGVSVWDWQDLTWFVRSRGLGYDLPVLAVSPWGHTAWRDAYPRKTATSRTKRWMTNHHTYTAFFKAVLDGRHMLFTEFDWGATLAILPDWMDIRRGPVPVVTNSTDKKVKDTPEGPYIFFEPSGSSPGGWIHWNHRWRSADAVDRPDRLEMTLYVGARGGIVTADVTPRRATKFRPKPGEKFRWSNTHLAEGDRKEWALRNVWKKYPTKAEIQNGIVTADEHGLLTLHKVTILPTKCRIVIERAEDKP